MIEVKNVIRLFILLCTHVTSIALWVFKPYHVKIAYSLSTETQDNKIRNLENQIKTRESADTGA